MVQWQWWSFPSFSSRGKGGSQHWHSTHGETLFLIGRKGKSRLAGNLPLVSGFLQCFHGTAFQVDKIAPIELHSKSPGEQGHDAGSVEENVGTSLKICRSGRIPLLQLLLTRDIWMKPHSCVLSIVWKEGFSQNDLTSSKSLLIQMCSICWSLVLCFYIELSSIN